MGNRAPGLVLDHFKRVCGRTKKAAFVDEPHGVGAAAVARIHAPEVLAQRRGVKEGVERLDLMGISLRLRGLMAALAHQRIRIIAGHNRQGPQLGGTVDLPVSRQERHVVNARRGNVLKGAGDETGEGGERFRRPQIQKARDAALVVVERARELRVVGFENREQRRKVHIQSDIILKVEHVPQLAFFHEGLQDKKPLRGVGPETVPETTVERGAPFKLPVGLAPGQRLPIHLFHVPRRFQREPGQCVPARHEVDRAGVKKPRLPKGVPGVGGDGGAEMDKNEAVFLGRVHNSNPHAGASLRKAGSMRGQKGTYSEAVSAST